MASYLKKFEDEKAKWQLKQYKFKTFFLWNKFWYTNIESLFFENDFEF